MICSWLDGSGVPPGRSRRRSAAAVASAMVPVAHGTDGLGSVRIPAAACGLFGIKPGTGIVPAQVGADSWRGLLENGPLATTVADAALMLEAMSGASFDLAERPGLRIAVSVKPPGPGVLISKACVAAVRQCADLLGGLGHKVQADDPRYPLWATPAMVAAWFACPAGDAPGPGVEPRTRRHVRAGRAMLRVRPPRPDDGERLRAAFGPFFERHDVLLTPTLARPCLPARRWGERSWLHSVVSSLTFAPMTGVWNVTGYPAASVPTPAATGLPGSVQLVAAPGGESVLLALAAQIERVQRWRRHAPAYDPSG